MESFKTLADAVALAEFAHRNPQDARRVMRKIVAEVYETSVGVRFIKKKGGGWIPLINPDEVDMGLGHRKPLSAYPGIERGIVEGLVELTEYIRDEK